MRSTHTLAILQVPPATIAEVTARITRVNQNGDYNHMFMEDGCIDMHGIALQADPEAAVTPDYDRAEIVQHALEQTTISPGLVHISKAKGLIEELAKLGHAVQRVAPEQEVSVENGLQNVLRSMREKDSKTVTFRREDIERMLEPGNEPFIVSFD